MNTSRNNKKRNYCLGLFALMLLLFGMGCESSSSDSAAQKTTGTGGFGGPLGNPGPTPPPGSGFQAVFMPDIFSVTGIGSVDDMTLDNSTAYIADCNQDRITRADLLNFTVNLQFISLDINDCPTGVAVDALNSIFIPAFNITFPEVSRWSLSSATRIATYTSNAKGLITQPWKVVVSPHNGWLFVLDVRNVENDRLLIIDPNVGGIIHQITLSQVGTRAIHARGNWVYAVNGGITAACFPPSCINGFGLDLIDVNTATLSSSPTWNIPLQYNPSGPNPGYPASIDTTQDNHYAYLGTDIGKLYKIDLIQKTVIHNVGNPIVINSSPTFNPTRIKITAGQGGFFSWVTTETPEQVTKFDVILDALDVNYQYSLNSNPTIQDGPFFMGSYKDAISAYDDVYILSAGSKKFSRIDTN